MKNSKVVQVLGALNEAELKEFKNFIYSPYFNNNKNLSKLFEYLKKYYPLFEEDKIRKEIVFENLFPGKAYSGQVMKNLSSGLLQLTLEFLGINKYKNQNLFDKELDILKELDIKRLDNIFESKLKKIENILNNPTLMIHPLFYHLHKAETIKSQFLLSRDKQKHLSENILKAGNYLVYYFITELSRLAIDLNANIESFNFKHSANVVSEVLEKFDIEYIVNFLIDNNYEYNEILNVYYHRLLAILESTDKNYYKYKNLLIENIDKFSLMETASLLESLHNIIIQRMNDGAENALREEFEIIKLKLEKNTIIINTGGKMTMLNFRNVIFTSVRLNEVKWAEEFVERHIGLVNKESKQGVYDHARGILAYVKGDYDSAIAHLSKVNLPNPFFISDVKTHMAIVFFEQGFYDSCISTLDSFRHILSNREEFTNIFKEVNIHFINALTSLIKVKSGGKNDGAILKIKEKLSAQKMVNHKSWLLRKADELLLNN
jgi:hypothetical protein